MYAQINEQFAAATRQFADTAARINRLTLENAEAIVGLQLAAIEERTSATFAFLGEAAQVRDFDGAKALWPKGAQVARENVERALTTGQDVVGRMVKANEAVAQIAKGQFEAVARNANETVKQAQEQFQQAATSAGKATEQAAANAQNASNGQKNGK
ncbi:phasin family protein [Lysobacter sp. N42]|uniref:phasin family protein n=1 Tax=Lysobacter sp. N42 TaxID=2545719 RepID=UPI0010497D79|nr:phasin family protein [Lysobacter sp. N42]TCZ82429.1 phasin family protein [Lysobacter sp. N42]